MDNEASKHTTSNKKAFCRFQEHEDGIQAELGDDARYPVTKMGLGDDATYLVTKMGFVSLQMPLKVMLCIFLV